MKKPAVDKDLLIVETYARTPEGKTLSFERVLQDRRVYYRLMVGGASTGSLTDASHAVETINYWREKGWIA